MYLHHKPDPDRLTPEELKFAPCRETAHHFSILHAEYEAALADGDEGWISNVVSEWRKASENAASRPLSDYQKSPLLQIGGPALPGDPEQAQDFAQALAYLEKITAHCLEFGLWQEKTAEDVTYELGYHNSWGRDQAGESYQETTLDHLHALSRRRIQAMEETGWSDTLLYRVAYFLDERIAQALTAEVALEEMMERSSIQADLPAR